MSDISKIALITSSGSRPMITIKDFYNSINWSPIQELDYIIHQHNHFYVQRNAPFYREHYISCLRHIDENIKKIFDNANNISSKINKSKFNFKELAKLYEDSVYGGSKLKNWWKESN